LGGQISKGRAPESRAFRVHGPHRRVGGVVRQSRQVETHAEVGVPDQPENREAVVQNAQKRREEAG